jgi:putative transcriptional regulator
MATRAALILLPARRMNYNEFRLEDRGRTLRRPKNPLTNPIAHVKQPLLRVNRGKAVVEFTPQEIAMIRVNFCASQREFAELIGISRETLRNWETGRRRPHGPARALLRAIDANPFVLARVLNWHTHPLKDEPDDWIDM